MFILKLATLKKMADKKVVLRGAAVEGCEQLFMGFQLAFDKKRVFNVKTCPLIEIDSTMSQVEIMKQGTYTWDMFLILLNLLEKNDLSDDDKKTLLYEAAEESGVLEWNAFYRPIIMKNLKCGVTAKTINGILDEFGADTLKYKVPVWKIQKLNDNGLAVGEKYIEPLLHGTRAITVINKDTKTVKMFSDTGREIKKPKIDLERLQDIIFQIPESIVLDGNVINRNYEALMTKDIESSHYAVYDIMLLRDFNQSYCPMELSDRKETLNELSSFFRTESDGQVFVLPSLLLDFGDEKTKEKLEFFKEEVAEAGYKGIVIKDVKSAYACEKDLSWYKSKI